MEEDPALECPDNDHHGSRKIADILSTGGIGVHDRAMLQYNMRAGFGAVLCSSVNGTPRRPSTAGSHGSGWCWATIVISGGQPLYSNTAYMKPIPPPSPTTMASVNGSPVCGAVYPAWRNRCAARVLNRCCPPPKRSYPGTRPGGSAGACSRATCVTTCRRAVEYDSPVRAIRSRTSFLRCLCSVIACPCSGRRQRGAQPTPHHGRAACVYSGQRRTTRDGIDHLRPRTAGGRGATGQGVRRAGAPAAV